MANYMYIRSLYEVTQEAILPRFPYNEIITENHFVATNEAKF